MPSSCFFIRSPEDRYPRLFVKERNDYQMIALLTHNLAPRSEKKEKKKNKEKEKEKKGTHVSKPYTRTFQSTVAGALNAQVSTVLTSVPKSY